MYFHSLTSHLISSSHHTMWTSNEYEEGLDDAFFYTFYPHCIFLIILVVVSIVSAAASSPACISWLAICLGMFFGVGLTVVSSMVARTYVHRSLVKRRAEQVAPQ
jgi:ABC-type transport system involved in cytochrome bd biosynthesis fused ATPase/permease subunit